ncbi:hypothetical protein QVD17_06031 [Tagetes erecta]|uniref:Uncharacterized protein n=1 Tax=Tagetes erecta TaxID=13708 RepID=A0AAD8PBY6_TARER|nr:hypothetical protein QVD17_06031 [Tagetes erecta]
MKRKNSSTNSRHKRSANKIIRTYDVDTCFEDQSTIDMDHSIASVESILRYKFNNKKLLEEALTHSSYTDSPSYQRLEFLGDSVLGHAISLFFFVTYPDVDAGKLSELRSVNVSTERLARVAVRLGLYKYIRHNKATVLSDKVLEFLIAVEEEAGMVVHGGRMKAPKVLVDIVESVAAAVYADCGFNMQILWMIFRRLLEPLVMLDVILAQPQPISALYEVCHKDGKQVDVKYNWNGDRNIASVFVDNIFIASGSSETKENAKLHAAEAALSKLTKFKSVDTSPQTNVDIHESMETEGAKRKVHDICIKKRWPMPIYRLEEELGPAHDKRYISSAQVEPSDTIIVVKGKERSRKKDAENSAASVMFCVLRAAGHT